MENQLPSTFEEFSETRRAGFLKAKEIKDAGGKIAGVFCTFTPVELLDAAGIYPVSLCGTSNETVAAAEVDLPKNLCPLIKSSYGFAVSDKCPYTYFSDIIVGETTCDGKKKMYELLGRFKNVYVLHLPQGVDREQDRQLWIAELHRFKAALEEQFDVTITDEALRNACRRWNRQRQAKTALLELQKQVPPPAYARDLVKVMDSSNFSFDRQAITEAIENMTRRIQSDYDAGARPVPASSKRILVTGCPIGGVLDKTVGIIESNGGVVVCLENCGGIKPSRLLVDTEREDILEAMADRYLNIGCAVMTPNPRRMELLRQLIPEFHVDGIVDIILQFCHPYNVERSQVKAIAKEFGIPYISIETDYSTSDVGQLSTRLSAFLEL